jgi:PPM family protein phosphatase
MESPWDYIALSFIGRRERNEDNCFAGKISDNVWLFAVADGMGGSVKGEIASYLAISALAQYIRLQSESFVPDPFPDLKSILYGSFQKAQESISAHTKTEESDRGMGTTLVVLLVYNNQYVWGNIGDSRLYVLDKDELLLLSRDHTHVQDYHEKNGQPAPPEMVDRYGHILTKAIDGGDDSPDIYPHDKPHCEIEYGNIFLLCSDGLFPDKMNVKTELIKNYIFGSDTLDLAGKNLISEAFFSGSTDNITVVLASFGLPTRKNLKLKKFTWPPQNNSVKTKKHLFGFLFRKRE